MATHSGAIAVKIPRTEEPGGLPPVGSQRARRDRVNGSRAETGALPFEAVGLAERGPPPSSLCSWRLKEVFSGVWTHPCLAFGQRKGWRWGRRGPECSLGAGAAAGPLPHACPLGAALHSQLPRPPPHGGREWWPLLAMPIWA